MKRRFSKHDPSCCCASCMAEDGSDARGYRHAGDPAGPGDAGGGGKDGGKEGSKPKPIYSLEEINVALTTNWEREFAGNSWKWNAKTVSYFIATDDRITPNDFGVGYNDGHLRAEAELMLARQDKAALAFELWDDLIPLELQRTTADQGDISIAYSSTVSGRQAVTQVYKGISADHSQILEQRIWFASDRRGHTADVELTYRSKGFFEFLHEIGHALGLSHPGPYNHVPGSDDDITYAEDAEHMQDTVMYTVMSYFGGWIEHDGRWIFIKDGAHLFPSALYPQTPMVHDIYVIRQKYEGETRTRVEDTTYGFGSTAGHAVFDFRETHNPMPRLTIWDDGGDDTLDVSGYTDSYDQFINLRPGSFSNIGALDNNVAIAFDSWIENATGGIGNDEIWGNRLANRLSGGDGSDMILGGDGDDTINGGQGADAMAGGSDNDTFVVNHRDDRVFELVDDGYDTVQVSADASAFAAGYTLPAEVERGVITSPGGNVLLGNGLPNVLVGSGEADWLDGGAGADQMHGGLGNDSYVVDNVHDRIFEDELGGKELGHRRVARLRPRDRSRLHASRLCGEWNGGHRRRPGAQRQRPSQHPARRNRGRHVEWRGWARSIRLPPRRSQRRHLR